MMKLIKENIGPTLIILFASALVIMAAWPVENSAWAEGIRSQPDHHGPEGAEGGEGGEGGEGEGRPGGIAMIFLPMVKVSILMGIGGLLTALGLFIAGRVAGNRKQVPESGG